MRISVECGGFDEAADACRTANHITALLTESLAGKLPGFAGMAGSHATSVEFASSYDAAAREAIGSLTDLTHAFIGVGRLLSATGANHAEAEAAASAGRGARPGERQETKVLHYSGGELHDDALVRVDPAVPPSIIGAQEPSFGVVDRWILDHVEGFVWPGADVALLRDAAHAWTRTGSAVDGLVRYIDAATTVVEGQHSPEIPVALACLADLKSLVADAAHELTALGSACSAYADAVEDVHDRTRALLADVGQMVVEGVMISAIAGALSGPFGGGATAAAVLARIRAIAPRFHALLTGLRTSVAAVASRLRTAQDSLRDVRVRLDRYAKASARDERGEIKHPLGWGGDKRIPGRPTRLRERPAPGSGARRRVEGAAGVTAEADFTQRLVETLPELSALLAEHLDDQEGELLPYLFMGDVATWLHTTSTSAPARVAEGLAWLEGEFAAGDFAVRNLIDVGIIEMLPALPEGRVVLDLLPPLLRARAEVAGLLSV